MGVANPQPCPDKISLKSLRPITRDKEGRYLIAQVDVGSMGGAERFLRRFPSATADRFRRSLGPGADGERQKFSELRLHQGGAISDRLGGWGELGGCGARSQALPIRDGGPIPPLLGSLGRYRETEIFRIVLAPRRGDIGSPHVDVGSMGGAELFLMRFPSTTAIGVRGLVNWWMILSGEHYSRIVRSGPPDKSRRDM
jgi:hypothetical protein